MHWHVESAKVNHNADKTGSGWHAGTLTGERATRPEALCWRQAHLTRHPARRLHHGVRSAKHACHLRKGSLLGRGNYSELAGASNRGWGGGETSGHKTQCKNHSLDKHQPVLTPMHYFTLTHRLQTTQHQHGETHIHTQRCPVRSVMEHDKLPFCPVTRITVGLRSNQPLIIWCYAQRQQISLTRLCYIICS